MDEIPATLSMVDLLALADAFPLLDRLALRVTMRNGGSRETVIFGILDGLREHLDATAPAGAQETAVVIRGWFAARLADEDAHAAEEE
jgi:hypothetical protein